LTNKLLIDKKLSIRDKKNLDFLVDAFNRMPLRAFSFIASIININKDNDFKSWTKKEFVDLYMAKSQDRKMLHPKIWGCFLQQGFGKEEIIPIDNWVESIYSNPLAIRDNDEFLNSFYKLGKLERLFWLVAQARKTNMQIIFNSLWCIKYGTGASTSVESNSKILRGPNPLSCYKCELRTNCVGYKNIKEKTIILSNSNNLKKMTTDFLVILQNNIPKKVYINDNSEPFLVDAFTGLELHKEKIELTKKIITVKEFIKKIKV
ncbi:MAG: hypothetical protein U9Q06_04295, partial [Nanoarchaeota archaeon]|nr:hypothetical protein [Nanoarchaeota archaeon]